MWSVMVPALTVAAYLAGFWLRGRSWATSSSTWWWSLPMSVVDRCVRRGGSRSGGVCVCEVVGVIADLGGVAEDVGGVGVPGGEAQGAPAAAA